MACVRYISGVMGVLSGEGDFNGFMAVFLYHILILYY